MNDQRYEIREVDVVPHADDVDSQFTLGNDEFVLDANGARAGQVSSRVTIYIATPTTATQCMAVTSDDTRCQREASAGSNYCGLPSHSPNNE